MEDIKKIIEEDRKQRALDTKLKHYAGRDYATPRCVEISRVDFEDHEDIYSLIKALTQLSEYEIIKIIEVETYYSSRISGFAAYRMETPEEIEERINGYIRDFSKDENRRRAEYERMKREFGDA